MALLGPGQAPGSKCLLGTRVRSYRGRGSEGVAASALGAPRSGNREARAVIGSLPVGYLVAEFTSQSFRAPIKPGEQPLFEDKFGLLKDESYVGVPQLHLTRAREIYDKLRYFVFDNFVFRLFI